MQYLRFIVAALWAVLFGSGIFAQTHDLSQKAIAKTETIKVMGNCEMCKSRIEKAAKIDGVNKAEWNKDSKVLMLAYDPSVIKSDDILKRIAAAGHDTEKFKADSKAYNSLPSCCKYR
jgi:periplasmic mercuric ion binding protein